LNWILRFQIVLLALSPAVFAADLTGRVIGIADGDTVTLLTSAKQQVRIRLAEIDAPESDQPYGNKSKQKLSELIFGKDVRVVVQTTDRYGRTVGRPYAGDLDVCEEMVRAGAVWVYRQYVIDKSLFDIEIEAREAKRGIWGLSEAQNMPPWEWRRTGGQEGAPEGCNIKGNINSKGDKIYHVHSGMSSYRATKIDESKGERWFCSEEEAQAAGWRAPRN
jgi:endonuclease YncB( thermonuclease family)